LGRRRHLEEKQVPISTGGAATAESVATMDTGAESLTFAGARSPIRLSSSLASSFSSLPSSFTTYLLGMFDSPAYANLTTTYLTEIFNRRTPDDPHVRYFSVAGRTGPLNVWHPLWLPKLILDGADGGEGNDGLVSVHSARWGEFLGIVEGADHWAVRGASGIELGVELPSVVSDAWGLADWGRIMRAVGRVERQGSEFEGQEKASKEIKRVQGSDEGLKSSTERVSAVLDWLVEQVPAGTRNGISFAGEGDSRCGSGAAGGATGMKGKAPVMAEKPRLDLESKRDLERLYVSLARKLYDEGL
jgi:triacylglycerol lipase